MVHFLRVRVGPLSFQVLSFFDLKLFQYLFICFHFFNVLSRTSLCDRLMIYSVHTDLEDVTSGCGQEHIQPYEGTGEHHVENIVDLLEVAK